MGTCADCVWWVVDKERCHAHPPTFFGERLGMQCQFPRTAPDDWCGVFKAVETVVTYVNQEIQTTEKGKDQ